MDSQWFGPAIGVLIVAILAWVIRAAWKRQRALEQAAAKLGMGYQKKDESLAESGVTRLPMFAKGQMRAVNVLKGEARRATFYLFDYVYVTRKRSGKRSSFNKGTYACLQLAGPKLPVLQIRPASRGSKKPPIEFPGLDRFAEHYIVTGDDERAVRQLLNEAFLDYLGRQGSDAWTVEVDGEWIGIAKRPALALKRHVKPDQMPQFRREVLQIYERLVK